MTHELQLRSDYWYDDGSVIIIVEETAFRVHKSILSQHSDVFADLFTIPEPAARESESLEGCSVVHLQDDLHDFTQVIKAIYKPFYFDELPQNADLRKLLGFISGILKISTKYNLTRIRQKCIDILQGKFPTTLSGCEELVSSGYQYNATTVVSAIPLARETNVPEILPWAFYISTNIDTDTLLADPVLSWRDKALCLAGKSQLWERQKEDTHKFLFEFARPSDCRIDDSDFNGHLSNSSYAKTMDSARFKAALAMFPRFFVAGGWMALAGTCFPPFELSYIKLTFLPATHYNFIREIPMLAPYEVRLSVGSWDQKWIYVVAKFVTKPSKKGKKTPKTVKQPTFPSNVDTNGTLFNASLRTDNQISTTSSPAEPTDSSLRTSDALKAVAASLSSQPEPDGAILNTISVSQCCFKIGRITVPPAVVLAANGFSVSASPLADGSPAVSYSRSNPPPHWAQAKAVMSRPAGGSKRKLQELFKGGWREVPEAERWWDAAMGGAVEERRKKGLEVLQSLGLGIAGVRNL
ncbi:hypothetical protein C0989_011323 [Termitomyces sp. Mn162]|nr:hypothetical protein C0989_011323 [Termitomyces sp. Mn162]